MTRADYCPVGSVPCQSMCDEPCRWRTDVGHAHFTPFYLLSNCRRLAAPEYLRKPNWALACDLFAVGSTTARRICREAGIDPEATEVRKVPT